MNYSPRPLLPEEQKEFRESLLSLTGEIAAAKRETNTVWKWTAVAGLAVGLSGAFAWVTLIPYLHVRVSDHFLAVDETHGFISEVLGAADAPKLFGPRIRETEIKKYADLYVEYEPGSDPKHFAQVQAMSSPDQAARYVAWHNTDPTAPRQATEAHGSVEAEHYSFYPSGSSVVKGVETFEYTMLFQRRQAGGGSAGKWEPWRANIQFHLDPLLVQTEDQAHDNPAGLVVTFFKAERVPQ